MTSLEAATGPLSTSLRGTWRLLSRIDTTPSGAVIPDPALGSDPIALLMYDRPGNFAAQFMKRDRSSNAVAGVAGARNNTQAQDGYDAYFGTYSVDDAAGVVTQKLVASLSRGNVGLVLSRAKTVTGDRLVISLDTNAVDGTVTRTLTWERVG